MKITSTAFSEKGIRSMNQDVYRISQSPDGQAALFLVCDGMGGHAMGDLAARTVADTITRYWDKHTARPDTPEKVRYAARAATQKLDWRSDTLRQIAMGTTMVMASVQGHRLTVAHCGDSRCYLIRDKQPFFRTQDHTRQDFGRESVTRCFFSHRPEAAVLDIEQFDLQPGDRIFLCSDGVYKSMPPEILAGRLSDDRTLEQVVDVIQFLCEKNGDDNYTGILVQVED